MNLSRFFSSSDNLLGTMHDEELQLVGNFFENLVTETTVDDEMHQVLVVSNLV